MCNGKRPCTPQSEAYVASVQCEAALYATERSVNKSPPQSEAYVAHVCNAKRAHISFNLISFTRETGEVGNLHLRCR